MGYKLGEAPEGWSPIWDSRYVTWGTVVITLHFLVIIIGAIYYSPDYWAFFSEPAVATTIVCTSFIVLFAIGYRYSFISSRQSMTLGRCFRVVDTRTISDQLFNEFPRQFYPIKRKAEPKNEYEQEDNERVSFHLDEHDGVLLVVKLTLKHERHFVEVEVATSDVNSHETRDLLRDLVEFFGERTMDWLSVDVVEDINLLDEEEKGRRNEPLWTTLNTRPGLKKGLSFLLVLAFAFWLFIAAAIADPVPGFVLNSAAVGIIVNPLLIGIFIIFIDDLMRMKRQGVMFEYNMVFHASPWYVTAAIEEGLRISHRSFVSSRRVDTRSLVESECFDLSPIGGSSLYIDVTWADHDKDPNWTIVHVSTSGIVEGIDGLLILVRKYIVERKI